MTLATILIVGFYLLYALGTTGMIWWIFGEEKTSCRRIDAIGMGYLWPFVLAVAGLFVIFEDAKRLICWLRGEGKKEK